MKKLMAAFLAGAILIGVGAGVTALEISEWDVVEHPYYLEKEQLKTHCIEEEFDMDNFSTIECYVSHAMRESLHSYDIIEIIEDSTCTDVTKIEVDYRGEQPESYWWDYGTDEVTADDSADNERIMQYIIQPGYNRSLRVVRKMVEQMFQDKVFYVDNASTLIEKVRIYTATPEKFDIIH